VVNPESTSVCKSCVSGQICCTRLRGLKLTPGEFDRHFAAHEDRLEIDRTGPFPVVSGRKGRACPHWRNGCRIYADRPIECRLYPQAIGRIRRSSSGVQLDVHSRTLCPHRRQLLLPDAEAAALATEFAMIAFGASGGPEIRLESPPARLLRLSAGRFRAAARRRFQRLMARLSGSSLRHGRPI